MLTTSTGLALISHSGASEESRLGCDPSLVTQTQVACVWKLYSAPFFWSKPYDLNLNAFHSLADPVPLLEMGPRGRTKVGVSPKACES